MCFMCVRFWQPQLFTCRKSRLFVSICYSFVSFVLIKVPISWGTEMEKVIILVSMSLHDSEERPVTISWSLWSSLICLIAYLPFILRRVIPSRIQRVSLVNQKEVWKCFRMNSDLIFIEDSTLIMHFFPPNALQISHGQGQQTGSSLYFRHLHSF